MVHVYPTAIKNNCLESIAWNKVCDEITICRKLVFVVSKIEKSIIYSHALTEAIPKHDKYSLSKIPNSGILQSRRNYSFLA